MSSSLKNARFGSLRVIRAVTPDRYTCLCKCGTYREFTESDLLSGHRKSCGVTCSLKKRADATNDARIVAAFELYKANAEIKNRRFELSQEEFTKLIFADCYYCGASPKGKPYQNKWRNGIDRVDNTQGYAVGNCVSCCWPCNSRKGRHDSDRIQKEAQRYQQLADGLSKFRK